MILNLLQKTNPPEQSELRIRQRCDLILIKSETSFLKKAHLYALHVGLDWGVEPHMQHLKVSGSQRIALDNLLNVSSAD